MHTLTDAREQLAIPQSDGLEYDLKSRTWYPNSRNETIKIIDSKPDWQWDSVRDKIKVYPVSYLTLCHAFLVSEFLCLVHNICPAAMA